MLKVALTGGIGCGKTLVGSVFRLLGVPVFHADSEAKKLYERKEIQQKISELFGQRILINGKLSLQALADLVFSHPDELQKLNGLIHPLVMSDFEKWCSVHQSLPYVIMESAIVFEAGITAVFDKIISVYAPAELCIKRVMERDKLPRQKINARMQQQMDISEKTAKSDYVIYNDDNHLVIPQVLEIHKQILTLAR